MFWWNGIFEKSNLLFFSITLMFVPRLLRYWSFITLKLLFLTIIFSDNKKLSTDDTRNSWIVEIASRKSAKTWMGRSKNCFGNPIIKNLVPILVKSFSSCKPVTRELSFLSLFITTAIRPLWVLLLSSKKQFSSLLQFRIKHGYCLLTIPSCS